MAQDPKAEEQHSKLRKKEDKTLTRHGETLQFRIKRSFLPDLSTLREQNNLHGVDGCANSSQVLTSADVDFVLVAHRRSPNRDEDSKYLKNATSYKSIGFRIGNALAKCCWGGSPVTDDEFERARLHYLAKLQKTYGLTIVQVDYDFDSRDRDGDGLDDDGVLRSYYLIKGAFAHFGLMAQLMSYQWPLNNEELLKQREEATRTVTQRSEPSVADGNTAVTITSPVQRDLYYNKIRNVFKSFYFFKRGKERYRDYKNCHQRSDFEETRRYDLMYHLLAGATLLMPRLVNPWRNLFSCSRDEVEEERRHRHKEMALMHFLDEEIFDDWLILHEPLARKNGPGENDQNEGCCASCCYSMLSCRCCCKPSAEAAEEGVSKSHGFCSSIWRFRGATDDEEQHVNLFHIMPLFEIRRYFGEKIGFYFAWVEFLTFSLLTPSVIGMAFFIVAVIYYTIEEVVFKHINQPEISANASDPSSTRIVFSVSAGSRILARACDNYATPFFAAIILIWGTAFSELWHRRSCWYQYLWRVDNVEATEFELPRSRWPRWVKALLRSRWGGRYILYIPSFLITTFFCCCVFASVYFVNVINVFSFPYCLRNGTKSPEDAVDSLQSTLFSANISDVAVTPTGFSGDVLICTSFDAARVIINSISILILDFIYTGIVYLLTDMECHKTQTQYNDALILKLFMFRFVNSYSILFFVAFAVAPKLVVYPSEIVGELDNSQREVLFGCNGSENCMALLTKQLLGCILTKPLFKSLTDALVPRLVLLLRILCRPKDAQTSSSVSKVDYRKAKHNSRKITAVNKITPLSSEDNAREMSSEQSSRLSGTGRPTLAPLMRGSSLPPLNNDGDRIVQRQPLPIPADKSISENSPSPVAVDSEESKKLLGELVETIERQYNMPKLSTLDRKEFTQIEYMDRMISYGALLMFSVALPPAPLLTLIILRIDCFLDIGRMVADYRRPLPFRAQDIGIWEKIVNFLTYCGILTNPLICILTSTWGTQLPMLWQFWTFLLFEHGMFLMRMLATSLINEVPPQLAKTKIRAKRFKDEIIASLAVAEKEEKEGPRYSTLRHRKHRPDAAVLDQVSTPNSEGIYPKI